MKWMMDAPEPVIVSGRGVFQSGTHIKIQVDDAELDIQLGEEHLVEALLGYCEFPEWEDVGHLLGKVFFRLVGESPEARRYFSTSALPQIQQAILNEMGY